MSLRAFFEHFDLLADAPDAVARLRELILQLAVQGKLVPQDPNDEPASALLERIVASRGAKQQKFALDSRAEQVVNEQGELPKQWIWTTLSALGDINPRNKIDDDLEVSFIPMPLIPAAYGDMVKSEIRLWKDIKKGYTHFAEGDVVLAKITPCFQNRKSTVMCGLKNGLGAGTTEIHVFRPIAGAIYADYVLIYLKSPAFVTGGSSKMTGTAGQQRVPTDYFAFSPFPLPPLAEQQRIVAKVDELMALCDELEREHEQRRAARLRLNAGSLDALLAAGGPDELAAAWQRVADSFDLLYDTPETVGKLRQAILQLAVQGRLVPQDPGDEPAGALLERIAEIRDRLLSKTKLMQFKTLSINANKILSNIPNSWTHVKLGELGTFLGGGTPSKSDNELWSGPIPWVSPKDMKKFHITDSQDHISPRALQESPVRLIPVNSILFVVRGMILAHSFPVAITKSEVTINQDMKALDLFLDDVADYLLLVFRGLKDNILQQVARSTHGTCKLEFFYLENFEIPLPPLAEQRRIVAKVDQLMALCDELEARLRQAQAEAGRLLAAMAAAVAAG